VAEILQGTLNACVAPCWILRRQSNDRRSEVRLQANATAKTGPVGPFACHELAVPSQNGVGHHEGDDLREQTATEAVSQLGQPSALAVVAFDFNLSPIGLCRYAPAAGPSLAQRACNRDSLRVALRSHMCAGRL
jgi:hypothetical protein